MAVLVRNGNQGYQVATFAAGASISDEVSLADTRTMAIGTPANIHGATIVSFQGAPPGSSTFGNIYKADGTEFTITVGVTRWTSIGNAIELVPYDRIKIRMGSSAAPTVQTVQIVVEVLSQSM